MRISSCIDGPQLLPGLPAVPLVASVRQVQPVLGQNEEDTPGICS